MEKNNISLTDLSILLEAIYRPLLHLKESKKLSDEEFFYITTYLEGLKRILNSEYFETQAQDILHGLSSSTSHGQLQSKVWILKTLKEKEIQDIGTVFLCAGWYGFLAFLLFRDSFFSIRNIYLFEKDALSVKVSEDLNRSFVKDNWRFKASLKDILEINYEGERFNTLKFNGEAEELFAIPDTIINTSCEHIVQFKEWWSKIPPKKLVILQSNDYRGIEEHVNCVSSLSEFKTMAPMGQLVYEGVLDLEKYKRFMLIGFKS